MLIEGSEDIIMVRMRVAITRGREKHNIKKLAYPNYPLSSSFIYKANMVPIYTRNYALIH